MLGEMGQSQKATIQDPITLEVDYDCLGFYQILEQPFLSQLMLSLSGVCVGTLLLMSTSAREVFGHS